MGNKIFQMLVLLCAFAMNTRVTWAQFSGNISGNVQDPTGASVPAATVTLTNDSTGEALTTKSDSGGAFLFVSLAPGNYKIAVVASGFATTNLSVALLTEQTLNVPVRLSVSTIAEKVEVTGEAPTINTADSRTQLTLESQAVAELPLQGRNLIALTTLAPGVTGLGLVGGSPGSAADNFSTETQVDASANGRGSVGNMYVVDGMDVTSDIRPGVLNLTPNPDSIQEMTVQPNTFTVDYGRASSVQMVMTSKYGTDQFHGNVSDYYTYQGFWAGTEFLHNYAPPFIATTFRAPSADRSSPTALIGFFGYFFSDV